MCCEVLDSNSLFFVLKMYFNLPQSCVFLFDVLSVAVFFTRDGFVKKKKKKKKKKDPKKTCA